MMSLANFGEALSENMWVLVPLGVFAFLAVGAIVDGIRKTLQTRAREQSRREVAAYVAEGSMTPEDAERILNAGGSASSGKKCC